MPSALGPLGRDAAVSSGACWEVVLPNSQPVTSAAATNSPTDLGVIAIDILTNTHQSPITKAQSAIANWELPID